MAIIVGEAIGAGAGKIGYANLFVDANATVTASSEEVGFEKENAYDWLGYDWWKPSANGESWIRASFASAQVANYMTIWGHDLNDHGSSIKPQYSNNGVDWIDATVEVIPADNTVIFISWGDISAPHYRALITNPTTIPVIAGIMVGRVLDLPIGVSMGFEPPSLVPNIISKSAVSELGTFIGGSILSSGISGAFTLDLVEPGWVRNQWLPFIQHVQSPKPFVFVWDDARYGDDAVLGWVSKKVSRPVFNQPHFMTVSLAFEGQL